MQIAPNAPFFVVLNAGSGHDDTSRRHATIRAVLDAAGRACTIEVVEDPARLDDTAQALAARAVAAHGVLVAAGGDGTLNTVAQAALAAGCPFGVLPQGTFNYFGRTHGIPEDLEDAVRALLTARVQPVQIGRVNAQIFLVNASIGLYPRLLEEREHDKRQYGRSRLVAILSALKTALRPHRRLHLTVELDGHTRHLRATTLFVGNNRLQMEQVGMQSLDAAIGEGQLAALAPRPVGKLGMLAMLLRGALGRLETSDALVSFAFRRLVLRAPRWPGRRQVKLATDGEVHTLRLPLEFAVLEGRLQLLVPAPSE